MKSTMKSNPQKNLECCEECHNKIYTDIYACMNHSCPCHSPTKGEQNQCDGCLRNLHIQNGTHFSEEGLIDSYCQKSIFFSQKTKKIEFQEGRFFNDSIAEIDTITNKLAVNLDSFIKQIIAKERSEAEQSMLNVTIKEWVEKVENEARQALKQELISELEAIRDDDSCECDNCHRTRKFIREKKIK